MPRQRRQTPSTARTTLPLISPPSPPVFGTELEVEDGRLADRAARGLGAADASVGVVRRTQVAPVILVQPWSGVGSVSLSLLQSIQ